MNIELQSCGLIMLLILLLIIRREKSLDLSSRRMFVRALYSCIACITMDILSIICIVNTVEGDLSRTVTYAVCKVYLVLLINQGYTGFLYAANEFFAEGTHRALRNFYKIVIIAGAAGILLLPIDIYCKGRVVYSYGPSTVAAYIASAILLVSTACMAFTGRDGTSRLRHRCILLWQGAWIAAALVQFLNPEILVVGFAAAFGIFLVYAELENPHEGIDRMTGLFTSNALYVYLGDLYRHDSRFAAINLVVEFRDDDVDFEEEQKALRRIARFIDSDSELGGTIGRSPEIRAGINNEDGSGGAELGGAIGYSAGKGSKGSRGARRRGVQIFRQADNELVIICDSEETMRAQYSHIVSGLEDEIGMPVSILCTLIPDGRVFRSVDEFMQFRHYRESRPVTSDLMEVGTAEAEEMREHFKIRDQISWALANGKVEVYYQPIYNIGERRFTSAEALVRIHDSDGNMVMPGKFIPIAETSGLIIPLGIEVFRQVCEFLATGRAQQLGLDYIEVNLSMAQFDQDNPAAFVQQLMSMYGVAPEWINLEITETADAITRQAVLRNMDTLISKGIRFSLDDFGTGRSNLDYFVTMPVHIVKFDYKFTHWYFSNEKARSVVEGTVDIIRKTGLPIVAEGVETEEQLRAMAELGVTFIQGFYYSRPLPQEEFVRFLESNQAA